MFDVLQGDTRYLCMQTYRCMYTGCYDYQGYLSGALTLARGLVCLVLGVCSDAVGSRTCVLVLLRLLGIQLSRVLTVACGLMCLIRSVHSDVLGPRVGGTLQGMGLAQYSGDSCAILCNAPMVSVAHGFHRIKKRVPDALRRL